MTDDDTFERRRTHLGTRPAGAIRVGGGEHDLATPYLDAARSLTNLRPIVIVSVADYLRYAKTSSLVRG